MKLSISNIAWNSKHDDAMLEYLSENGFQGIEVAPTRITPENPYDHFKAANEFKQKTLKAKLEIPSMQSIWYGRTERVFYGDDERQTLTDYSKKAINFALMLGCENLVFGSPKNRVLENKDNIEKGLDMMRDIAEYASENGTCFSLEANPEIYGTNFINTTPEAFELVKQLECPSFLVNVDFGTIIENKEDLTPIAKNIEWVNHIHISEPFLVPIKQRKQHEEFAALLTETGYNRFVSIEMKDAGDMSILKDAMAYVRGVFG